VSTPGLPDVLVKRDDLSGFGRGGAKTRKLEHLVGHLLAHGYDELVAVAGNVTNLAFDLLPALDRHGVRASLFIIDDPPLPRAVRERIFEGVRDRVELASAKRAEVFLQMLRTCARARRRGRRPFFAFPGVSHPSGVLGNARGFVEMVEALTQTRQCLPDTVFVTAATGTTLAGFLLAERALSAAGYPPIRVVGVQVYPGAIVRTTHALVRWAELSLGLETHAPARRIEVSPEALGDGFGHFTPELEGLCANVAEHTSFVIDPIFGGKTWAVMRAELSRRPAQRALYWHCGVTPEWETLGRAVRRSREGGT
jgi:1-aminocyclopropane-1-carboxylate deaminase/D-cysteine desulfhydrase-like pyridoxal-dependent ACC family enzyme